MKLPVLYQMSQQHVVGTCWDILRYGNLSPALGCVETLQIILLTNSAGVCDISRPRKKNTVTRTKQECSDGHLEEI
jgi:hypothetical protein